MEAAVEHNFASPWDRFLLGCLCPEEERSGSSLRGVLDEASLIEDREQQRGAGSSSDISLASSASSRSAGSDGMEGLGQGREPCFS